MFIINLFSPRNAALLI